MEKELNTQKLLPKATYQFNNARNFYYLINLINFLIFYSQINSNILCLHLLQD